MYEIPDVLVKVDNKYRTRCIVDIHGERREVIFSRNDYDIVFISFDNLEIRAIVMPIFVDPQVALDIQRVHPTIPICYFLCLSIPSMMAFSYGLILGNGAMNVHND